MIQLSIKENGEPYVRMQSPSPTVYLDHWALRRFSDDEELAARLTAGLMSRGGTLAISWVNLAEFTKVTVEQQARKAENLIESNFSQVFLLEVNPFLVIERENRLLDGARPTPPHADMDFLKAIVGLDPSSVNLLSARDLFTVVRDPGSMRRLNNLADTIVERVEGLRGQLDTDSEFQAAITQLPSGAAIQRGTRFMLRELVRTLLIDSRTKMTRNHAIDLFHAVVPTAYCDLVLLDKHWETQVDRVRARLVSASISIPVAMVFSGKGDGVNRFLKELQADP